MCWLTHIDTGMSLGSSLTLAGDLNSLPHRQLRRVDRLLRHGTWFSWGEKNSRLETTVSFLIHPQKSYLAIPILLTLAASHQVQTTLKKSKLKLHPLKKGLPKSVPMPLMSPLGLLWRIFVIVVVLVTCPLSHRYL